MLRRNVIHSGQPGRNKRDHKQHTSDRSRFDYSPARHATKTSDCRAASPGEPGPAPRMATPSAAGDVVDGVSNPTFVVVGRRQLGEKFPSNVGDELHIVRAPGEGRGS